LKPRYLRGTPRPDNGSIGGWEKKCTTQESESPYGSYASL